MLLNKKNKPIIKKALLEDIGTQDVTTNLTIPAFSKTEAIIVAKQSGILCGAQVAKEAFKQVDKNLKVKIFKKEGSQIKAKDKIIQISGKTRSILTAERVALNFLSLLSGVATSTYKYVQKVKDTKVKILDTRKTTPLLRDFEKYAVRVAGGQNHRYLLSEAILVKDNHLRAIGYIHRGRVSKSKIKELIKNLRKCSNLTIEVEVENVEEFKIVAQYNPDTIMLDNFSIDKLKKAVKLRKKLFPGIKLEASGGINLKNVKSVALTGVDFISIGRITHSRVAIDFSLELL